MTVNAMMTAKTATRTKATTRMTTRTTANAEPAAAKRPGKTGWKRKALTAKTAEPNLQP